MLQHSKLSSTSGYGEIRVKYIHRRRHNPKSSKVSYMKNACQSSTIVPYDQSVLSNNTGQNRSETFASTEAGIVASDKKNQDNHLKPQQLPNNQSWKDIFKIIWSVFGILLLIPLILPSILVYIYAPKSVQTGLSTPSISTNQCASISPSNLWQYSDATTLTMIIDTSVCQFTQTPLYFVSIGGIGSHFCLTGYGGVYQPTKNSFQIYAQSICNYWNSTTFLNAAYSNAWDIYWMGFYKYI